MSNFKMKMINEKYIFLLLKNYNRKLNIFHFIQQNLFKIKIKRLNRIEGFQLADVSQSILN